jgi:hypothetical protein
MEKYLLDIWYASGVVLDFSCYEEKLVLVSKPFMNPPTGV